MQKSAGATAVGYSQRHTGSTCRRWSWPSSWSSRPPPSQPASDPERTTRPQRTRGSDLDPPRRRPRSRRSPACWRSSSRERFPVRWRKTMVQIRFSGSSVMQCKKFASLGDWPVKREPWSWWWHRRTFLPVRACGASVDPSSRPGRAVDERKVDKLTFWWLEKKFMFVTNSCVGAITHWDHSEGTVHHTSSYSGVDWTLDSCLHEYTGGVVENLQEGWTQSG